MPEYDTDYTDEVVCPHCGHKHNDSWEIEEGEYQCDECDGKFHVTINTTITYSTKPA